ncbi:MAK10-like protein [Tanacetum coccineum]
MFRNPFSSTTIGDANPIRTLGDYSKPSYEGYRNTIELLVGNNVVPLRSDTIRLVQNGCSFHRLRSEDPNQHLKDFLKLVDSLDLDGKNRERTRMRLFQISLRDQASKWLERLPAGSITIWEDLTTRFLAQFFPSRRTAKLRNNILMFQQHHGESLSEAWTRFKDLLQKVPHHGIDLWLQDLALYDNESWNDPRDFAKLVKTISLPQDVLSTSDRRLIKLENQVQCLMQAHLAPTQPTQVNKITNSYEICSGPHDTQYCMEDPEQAFVEYASSRTDEVGGDDGDVMFIKIVKKNDDSRKEEPEAGGSKIMRRKLDPRENSDRGVSNFTGRIKGMHVFIRNFTYVTDFMIVEDISSIIDPRLSQVVLGKPFVDISNMTHDPPEGVVRFTKGTDKVAYKMTQKIEQYNSLSDLEKEHTKSVYLRNEEDKRKGVEYVMSKILGFYKECLELGPEYVTGMDDEGKVTKFLIKNEEEFFTDAEDGVGINTRRRRVSSNVIFDEKKLGSS